MNRVSGMTGAVILALACGDGVIAQTPAAPAGYSQIGAPLVASAANQPPTPAAPGPTLDLSLDAARAALQACTKIEQKIGVTVVDSAGIPKVVLASDGASARGVQSRTNKALTALAFQASTSELDEKSKSDTRLSAELAKNPTYNVHAGGLVLRQGAKVLGAVGVGGAKGSDKDEACANAALAILQSHAPARAGG